MLYTELQAELKKRGIKAKGKKAVLEALLQKDNERLASLNSKKQVEKSNTTTDRPTKRSKTTCPSVAATKSTSKNNSIHVTNVAVNTKTNNAAINTSSIIPTVHVNDGVSLSSGSLLENKKRGVRISGRFWKRPQKRSSNRRSKAEQKRLWDQKELGKQGFKDMKSLERNFIANREEERKARIEKLLAKRKRKAENEMKSSQYQQLTSDSKIKRMSKSQLKLVKRMQVNAYTGVTELVSPWAGRQIRGKHAGTWRGR
jgi:hypothetical protein